MTKIQLTKNPLAKLPPTDYPTDKNPQLPNSDKNPAFSQHHTSSLKNKLKKENPGFFCLNLVIGVFCWRDFCFPLQNTFNVDMLST